MWFKGCIKKLSICTWMGFLGRLKTKSFLISRNVNCYSNCVFCPSTSETQDHLFLQYPFSMQVWKGLLYMFYLQPIPCVSLLELIQSTLLGVDQNSKGMTSLCKLIFTAFIWHIWREKNAHIFRNVSRGADHVIRDIISMVYSMCMLLGFQVPSNTESRWNLSPFLGPRHSSLVAEVLPKEGWRMSIVHIYPLLVGVVWSENGDLVLGATRYSQDCCHAALSLLQMIPMHASISMFELDGHIQALVKNPLKSPWRERFTV